VARNPTTSTKVKTVITDISQLLSQSDAMLANRESNISSGRSGDWMAENSGQSLTAVRRACLQMKWAFQNEVSLGLDSNGVCATGDGAYNQRLSQRRADSVRQWLVRNKLSDRNSR
jgi:hypothetical protein